MAPYICHIHNGLYNSSPDSEGCQDEYCVELANKEVRPVGIFMAGSGGSRSVQMARENSDTFHNDMYSYKAAVDQGVNPDQVTAKAAETALKKAEAS